MTDRIPTFDEFLQARVNAYYPVPALNPDTKRTFHSFICGVALDYVEKYESHISPVEAARLRNLAESHTTGPR